MRVALCQFNPTVGDLAANSARIAEMAHQAARQKPHLIVFSELSLCGYPPRDLVEKPSFVAQNAERLTHLAQQLASLDAAVVVGYVAAAEHHHGKRAANHAAVLRGGSVVFEQRKMLLPTYDVFDEGRYFLPADRQHMWLENGRRVALTVCEDAWNDKQLWDRPLYGRDPVEELAGQGGQLLVSINASPYDMAKRQLRRDVFTHTATRFRMPVVYVNQVGGNDQLVFDGSSFAVDATGRVIAQCASFSEDIVIADLDAGQGEIHATHADELEAVYDALVLGTRDYLRKCGFRQVLIGLSGGIDSSLTAAVAVEAVGKENVIGVAMPGPFSSDHSLTDARDMAQAMGLRFEVSSINPAYQAFLANLQPLFGDRPRDVTEENIQSRLRGLTLMSLSNKFNALVLTTGNKSELAVGYCTLYGDMCGGLAVISDVPKVMVYDLCRIANRRLGNAIPENVFTKPPSAELRPDQKDSDSLPEYEVLDAILERYIEKMQPAAQIAAELHLPLTLVRDIATKVDRNEYKRQQAAPGLKVTTKAFGVGRRFPIAQRFSE